MKINITTTRDSGPYKHTIDIPTGWEQVTFKQYLGLIKAGTDINEILSVFTGLDVSVLKKAIVKNLGAVTACLHFVNRPPVYGLPVTIQGYKIPKNLETQSTAQFEDLKAILAKFKYPEEGKQLSIDDHIFNYNLYPSIVAVYAIANENDKDPVKSYDYEYAEYIAPRFFNSPCTEVLAVGNFTRVRLHALSLGIVPTSPPERVTRLNKLKQGLINWLQSLASSIRYHTWKKSLPLSEQRYLNGL